MCVGFRMSRLTHRQARDGFIERFPTHVKILIRPDAQPNKRRPSFTYVIHDDHDVQLFRGKKPFRFPKMYIRVQFLGVHARPVASTAEFCGRAKQDANTVVNDANGE